MFPSFFLAGFEGTSGYNKHGRRIDSLARTKHDERIYEDYAMIRRAGFLAARESIRWPQIESHGRRNFSTIQPALTAARRNRIVLIHDLFHFGYPGGLDPMSREFPQQFADYCFDAARFISRHTDGACYFTPVNEPSYFAWAGGEAGLFAPFLKGQGRDLKRALVAAAIEGINAIWAACPAAHIINVDPYCRVIPSLNDAELEHRCEEFNSTSVFEAWDMLAGIRCPELGGSRRHLGIVGVNYYWTNQWFIDQPNAALPEAHPGRVSLSEIVRLIWNRYHTDILITETCHVDDRRIDWVTQLGFEVDMILNAGIPLTGVCWYPILEMPEWHSDQWTKLGLWDLDHAKSLKRIPCIPALQALRRIEERLSYRKHSECILYV